MADGVESYAVYAGFGLDVAPAIAAQQKVIETYRQILAVQKQIQTAQDAITGAIRASAGAAKDFADQMVRAAGAAQRMAQQTAAAAQAQTRAARESAAAASAAAASQPAGRTPGTALVPAPRLLPAPQRGFTMVGEPYGPGTGLVPTGQGWTQTETTGRASPEYGGITPYGQRGVGYPRPGAKPEDEFQYDGPGGGGGGGPGGPRGPGYFSGPFGGAIKGMLAFEGANVAKDAIFGSYDAAASKDAVLAALGRGAEGMSADDVKRAYEAAQKTQADVMGAYVLNNLKIIATMMSVTQDANASIKAMPSIARYHAEMQGLGRDADADATSLIYASELRGVVLKDDGHGGEKFDADAFGKMVKNAETMSAVTGGRYGMTDLLKFFRSGGIAAKTLTSDDGFMEWLAVMQSMGDQKAGTALKGFGQQFVSGRMSLGTTAFLEELGLMKSNVPGVDTILKANKKIAAQNKLRRKAGYPPLPLEPIGPDTPQQDEIYHEHHGLMEYMYPGAMRDGDMEMAAQRPEQFILQRVLPAVQANLAKEYGKKYSDAAPDQKMVYEQAELGRVASRMPPGDMMAQIIAVTKLIDRDLRAGEAYNASQATGGPSLYDAAVKSNPQMVAHAMNAEMNAFMITMGDTQMAMAVTTLRGLTSALEGLRKVLETYNAFNRLWSGTDATGAHPGDKPGMSFGPIDQVGKVLTGVANVANATGFGPKQINAWGDRNLPGFAALHHWLSSFMNIDGTPDPASARAGEAKAPVTNVAVSVKMDSKDIAAQVVKQITSGAGAPSRGTGSFDERRAAPRVDN